MSRVGVLMPVYNCKNYIVRALDSILNQTFSDFRVYIIDDHSTDGTYEILQTYADNRIRLHRNSQNMGLVFSLNYGVSLISEEYLARMDGDDFAFPDRLKKQVNYLDKNGGVALCGTQGYWTKFGQGFTDRLLSHKWFYPTEYENIKAELFFGSCFGHSSIMLRRQILTQMHSESIYDQSYMVSCEDWDLWFRLSKNFKIVNLPEYLMEYTIHDSSLHRSNYRQKQHDELNLKNKILGFYGVKAKSSEILKFDAYIVESSSNKSFLDVLDLFDSIYFANNTINFIDKKVLKKTLLSHSIGLFLKSKNGFLSFSTFFFKPFFEFKNLSTKQLLKVIIKCISLS